MYLGQSSLAASFSRNKESRFIMQKRLNLTSVRVPRGRRSILFLVGNRGRMASNFASPIQDDRASLTNRHLDPTILSLTTNDVRRTVL